MSQPTATASQPDLVRTADLAARYDVTPRTVLNWISRGLIPAVKIGKVTRIRYAEAVAALEGEGVTAP